MVKKVLYISTTRDIDLISIVIIAKVISLNQLYIKLI